MSTTLSTNLKKPVFMGVWRAEL